MHRSTFYHAYGKKVMSRRYGVLITRRLTKQATHNFVHQLIKLRDVYLVIRDLRCIVFLLSHVRDY